MADDPKIATELRIKGPVADFIILTDDPLYQDRAVHMGWQRIGDAAFVRHLAAPSDVERIFDNFTRHVVEMVEQSARLRPVLWEQALGEFIDRTHGSELRWWLYGSGALAVRGLEVEPGDLDIAVNDPHLAGEILNDLLVEPVTRLDHWVADWVGRAFHGALLEWLAGAHPTGLSPPSEYEPGAADHLETISWRGRVVMVPRLELQLAVAERRSLHQRAAVIRQAMGG